MRDSRIQLSFWQYPSEKLIFISLLVGLIAGGIIFYHFDPSQSPIYPFCPFHAITGFYCPGCGSFRAVYQLLHGNFPAAFRLNPLAAVFLPYIVYSFLSYAKRAVTGRPLPEVFLPASVIWIIFGVIIVFFVLRNIPAYPFRLLAPGGIP